MDFKKVLPFMLLAMALIVFWPPLMEYVARKNNWKLPNERPTTQMSSATQPVIDASGNPTSGVSAPPNSSSPNSPSTGAASTSPGVALPSRDASTLPAAVSGAYTILNQVGAEQTTEQTTELGLTAIDSLEYKERKESPWAMRLSLSNVGAAISQVSLSDYRNNLREKSPYTFATGEKGFIELTRPMATRALIIDGTRIDLTNARWTIAQTSLDAGAQRQFVRYELNIARDNIPAIRISKTYALFSRAAKPAEGTVEGTVEGPLGYEPVAGHVIENLTANPISVALITNGPNCPPAESERMPDRQIISGHDMGTGRVRIEHKYTDSITETPWELTKHPNDYPFVWICGATVYFNAIIRPEPIAPAVHPEYIESVRAVSITPLVYGAERAIGTAIQTKPFIIESGESLDLNFRMYFGPRKREVLTNNYFAKPFVEYAASLVIAAWPCGICTFGWLIDILFSVLKAFHFVLRDWGLAIIALVVLVRTLLHPITKRSQLSMMKMGKMGPEVERLKKKFADDKDGLNKAMIQFYKQQGAAPILGCLPMFLQMPIWIALWQALQTTFDLRHAPAFYGLTWINDLSKPDHLIDFADYGWRTLHVPLLPFTTISGLNILPLLMGVIMYYQIKIQPKPVSMTPEQAQQQKIVQIMMIFMMPVFLYGSPSGLTLYIITSTLLGIFETKIVRRQYEAQEAEAAKFQIVEGEVVTAAAASRPASLGTPVNRPAEKKVRPTGKIAGIFFDLNQRAEDMRDKLEKQQNITGKSGQKPKKKK